MTFYPFTRIWKHLYNKSTKTRCGMCAFGFARGSHICWRPK